MKSNSNFFIPGPFQAHVVTWDTIHLHGTLWRDHHRLRKQVFIDRLNYQVPHCERWEWDQYDTPNAVYLLVTWNGQVVASCRLVPTTGPYMIRDIFPDLHEGPPPAREDTWEMTRILTSDLPPESIRRIALLALLLAMQDFCLSRRVSFLLALMPDTIFRNMERRGDIKFHVHEKKSRKIDGVISSALIMGINEKMRWNLIKKIKKETDSIANTFPRNESYATLVC